MAAVGAALAAAAWFASGSRAAAPPLLSVSEEIKLGREAQAQVAKQVPRLEDPGVRDYITRVGRRLAARATGPRYPYTFTVANYRELNAFALPGGPVWINRGVIRAASNESQLAAVLSHEIAHIAARHAADQMTSQLVTNGLLGLLSAVLGNGGSAATARIGAQVLANGYLLKFSRDDEREADRVGLGIMQRAGWDPAGMAGFMETLRREQGRDPCSVEVFLSSHPAPGERAAVIRRMLPNPPAGRRDSAAFRAIRTRVRQLHPATTMTR